MKKTIIRIISIALLATLLAAPGVSTASSTTASTEILNPVELFPLTLTPEELLVLLKEYEIKIIGPKPGDFGYELDRFGDDGRVYDGIYAHFFYRCEGIEFVFYADNEKMKYFEVSGDKFATPKGIRVGDSRWTVIKKYGICSKLVGGILDFFGIFTGKAGYDAKTKDGYYRFNFDGEKKKCDNPLDSWSFYNDRRIYSFN